MSSARDLIPRASIPVPHAILYQVCLLEVGISLTLMKWAGVKLWPFSCQKAVEQLRGIFSPCIWKMCLTKYILILNHGHNISHKYRRNFNQQATPQILQQFYSFCKAIGRSRIYSRRVQYTASWTMGEIRFIRFIDCKAERDLSRSSGQPLH